MKLSAIMACIDRFPVEQAILLIANHGVGKSEFCKQLAEKEGKTYIDQRLGTMTEGDLLGLYQIQDGKTVNYPPDWFMEACETPCVLNLDELNRALPNVLQGVFQIVLDRKLGKYELHPETRVMACINQGGDYDVLSMDPALKSRFAIIDFKPTIEEFLVWADKHMHPLAVEFLTKNQPHIEVFEGMVENKVYPCRRSWKKVSDALKEDLDNREYTYIYDVASTMVGSEAGASFLKFLENKKEVYFKDILEGYKKEMLDDISNDDMARVVDQMTEYIIANEGLKEEWQGNWVAFVKDLPDEFVASIWRKLSKTSLASEVGNLILDELDRALT